jgi:hypothetical protein
VILPAMIWLPGDTCEDIRCITTAGMEYAEAFGLWDGRVSVVHEGERSRLSARVRWDIADTH